MAVKKTLTFEQAIGRLDEIAALLDEGEVSLEQSLKLFAEGAQLMGVCEKKLEDARLTVETLFPQQRAQEVEDEQL